MIFRFQSTWPRVTAMILTSLAAMLDVTSPKFPNCSRQENHMNFSSRFVFVGDNLRLCCDVSNVSSDVIQPAKVVTFYRRYTSLSAVELPQRAKGSRGAVCVDVTMETASSEYYYCFVAVRAVSAELPYVERPRCLGYRLISSGHRPEKVLQNVWMECVMESHKLTCSFGNLSNFFDSRQRVQVSVFYRDNEHEHINKSCTTNCTEKKCDCTLHQGSPVRMYSAYRLYLTLEVRYTEFEGRVYRRVYTVIPKHVEKLRPPSSISVSNVTARSMLVSWETEGSNPQLCNFTLLSSHHAPMALSVLVEQKGNDADLLRPRQPREKRVQGLRPFTYYNVSLQCRAVCSRVWSDVVTTTALTSIAPPERSPDMAPGYSLDKEGHSVFYWKALPELQANGPTLSYIVGVVSNQREQSSSPPPIPQNLGRRLLTNHTQASLETLDFGQRSFLSVCVWALNQAGVTLNGSCRLFGHDYTVPNVRAILENEVDQMMTLNIAWSVTSRPVASYTAFWCLRGDNLTRTCQGSISWHTVESSQIWHSIELPSGDWPLHRLLYGVTAHYDVPAHYDVTARYDVTRVKVISSFRFRSCVLTRRNDGTMTQAVGTDCEDLGDGDEDGSNTLFVGIMVLVLLLSAVFTITCFVWLGSKYRKLTRKFSPSIKEESPFPSSKGLMLKQNSQDLASEDTQGQGQDIEVSINDRLLCEPQPDPSNRSAPAYIAAPPSPPPALYTPAPPGCLPADAYVYREQNESATQISSEEEDSDGEVDTVSDSSEAVSQYSESVSSDGFRSPMFHERYQPL